MTDNDIDAIRQREQAADPGPWTAHPDGLVWSQLIGDPVSGSVLVENAEFIAHARTDVPALLAKVDELTAEVRSVTYQLTETVNDLTQSRAQAATYANEIGTLTAENARVRQQRDGLLADLTDAGNEVDLLTAENTRLRSQAAELRALYTGLADGPPVNADWLLGELGRLTRVETAEATR